MVQLPHLSFPASHARSAHGEAGDGQFRDGAILRGPRHHR
jgi:hypothetical protein